MYQEAILSLGGVSELFREVLSYSVWADSELRKKKKLSSESQWNINLIKSGAWLYNFSAFKYLIICTSGNFSDVS